MSWDRFARFQIIGFVERKFVPPSGKCAFLTLSVPGKAKDCKLEFVTFEHELIVQVGSCGVGQTAQVKGTIGIKSLQDKARKDVEVDGRSVWFPQLIITKLDIEGEKPRAAPTPADLPVDREPGDALPNDPIDNW